MLATAIAFRSFRGRSAELEHLLQRRRDASAGRGGMVLISGEAGAGKSRLLAEFRAKLDSARLHVAVAQCRESSNRPYSAVLDGLSRLGEDAAQVQPALSRAEQFAQIQQRMRSLTQRRSAVLTIEDLHWATSDTLELLEAIVSDAASMRLLVVATHRSGDPDEDSPAFKALVRLHRLTQTTHIILEPLSDAVVGELLQDAAENVPLDVRRRIVRLCEGNPFFAEELLRNAAMERQAVNRSAHLPFAVRALLQERFHALPPADREVLAQASILGRRFSLEMLAGILHLSREELLRSLRAARDLHLIVEEDAGTFAFAHALTREAVRATLLEAQATELHRRAALALESTDARNIHDLAYHWWAARDAERAFTYGVQAGDEAMALFAYEEATLAYSYAFAYVDKTSERAAGPLMKMGLAYGRLGLKKLAHEAIAQAKAAYALAGDLAGECEAAIELAAARFILGEREPEQPILDVRPRLTNARLRRRADVALAQIYLLRGDFARGAQMLAGMRIDPALDELRTVVTYHAMRGMLAQRDGDVPKYIEAMRCAIDAAREGGLTSEPAMILSNLASGLTLLAYLDEAAEISREAQAMVSRRNLTVVSKFLQLTEIARTVLCGALPDARSMIEQCAREVAESADLRALISGWGLFVGRLLDDASMCDRYFTPQLDMPSPPPHLVAATALRLHDLGRQAEASALVSEALSADEGSRALFILHLTAAQVGDSAVQAKARASLAGLAVRPHDRIFRAALPLFDALVAAGCGNFAESAVHAAAAAEHFRILAFPLWEAQALELQGDVDRAAAIYRRIGAVLPLRNALVRQTGGPPSPVRAAAEALSPREREVAELVASGASNSAVAQKLSITVKAVEKHLSSIYGKLAISSRAQLATHFHRRNDSISMRPV